MSFVRSSKDGGIATITLSRGKVNALNEVMVEQVNGYLEDLENDQAVKAVILTGQGKFFSFGSVEMLKFCVGQKDAETILYSGMMYSAEEAGHLGLVDQISSEESLTDEARKVAQDFAKKDNAAFKSIKGLLRRPVAEEMIKREKDSIREFADIWYSENTWENLKEIKIYS